MAPLPNSLCGKVARRALGLAAFAAGAVCVFARISPGAYTYDASNVFTPCLEVKDGQEHWGIPRCHGESRVGGKKAEMTFNSVGLRDRDYSTRAATGVLRILVLGSSNTLGPGVAERDTLPRQLERELQSGGRRVEVINAGMVGYCTVQMAIRARDLIRTYSPKFVLLQYVQGSCPLFDGAWSPRVRYESGRPLRIDRSPFEAAGPFGGVNKFLYAHPFLFFEWLTWLDGLLKIRFSRSIPAGSVDEFLAPTIRFLQRVRDDAREAGAGFAAFGYKMRPFTQSIPAQMNAPLAKALATFIRPPGATNEELLSRLRAAGIPFVYDPAPTEENLVPGDVHLNETGIARFAKATAAGLAPFLQPYLAPVERPRR